jgi:hypothetical protein
MLQADIRHTGIGFATHHAAALMWGFLFEKLRERDGSQASSVLKHAAIASATAALVDYTITPHRFTPGWELVLSKKSMAIGYMAMAVGFIAAEYVLPPRETRLYQDGR